MQGRTTSTRAADLAVEEPLLRTRARSNARACARCCSAPTKAARQPDAQHDTAAQNRQIRLKETTDDRSIDGARRQFVAAAGAALAALADAARIANAAADARQDWLRLAADRPAGAVRRGRQVGHRSADADAFKDGLTIGGKKYDVQIIVKDSQSNPNRAGEVANDLILKDKVDLMLVCRHARNRQPGQRCVRGERGAVHLDRGAVAAVVLRPQGRSGEGLQLDLSLLLGPRRRHRRLHQHVASGADQQGGRRPVPQRRRRQRLGRQASSASRGARAEGLHADRPGPLPERDAGLLRADLRVQARRRRRSSPAS